MAYFNRVPIRYRTVLLTAAVLATLFLFQAYMHHYVYKDIRDLGEFRWWREAPVPYLNFFFWALLAPLVYTLLQRLPFTHQPQWGIMLAHLGLGLAIATFHEVVTSSLYYAILQLRGEFDFTDPKYRDWAYHALVPAVFTRTMEYWVLMGVMVALENARLRREEHEQLLRLRNELQSTQLNALKKQLQPHFLFNTLNTVSALMDGHVNDARRVLSRLGQLLRATLDQSRADMVPLEQEVDYIRDYLDIESIRFRDRLAVHYDVPPELLGARVPSLVLQPLVENAIKHGSDGTQEHVRIGVRARLRDGRLELEVSDNGKGCNDVHSAMANGGIGLKNVRERIGLLYGGAGALRLHSPAEGGFRVTVSLPYDSDTNETNRP